MVKSLEGSGMNRREALRFGVGAAAAAALGGASEAHAEKTPPKPEKRVEGSEREEAIQDEAIILDFLSELFPLVRTDIQKSDQVPKEVEQVVQNFFSRYAKELASPALKHDPEWDTSPTAGSDAIAARRASMLVDRAAGTQPPETACNPAFVSNYLSRLTLWKMYDAHDELRMWREWKKREEQKKEWRVPPPPDVRKA